MGYTKVDDMSEISLLKHLLIQIKPFSQLDSKLYVASLYLTAVAVLSSISYVHVFYCYGVIKMLKFKFILSATMYLSLYS